MPVPSNISDAVEKAIVKFADVPKDKIIGALILATDVSRSLADALSYSIVSMTAVDVDHAAELADFLMNEVITEDAYFLIEELARQAVKSGD